MKNTFKAWRQANGLTQFQAADALGVARSTIARYEAGYPLPKVVLLAMTALSANQGSETPASYVPCVNTEVKMPKKMMDALNGIEAIGAVTNYKSVTHEFVINYLTDRHGKELADKFKPEYLVTKFLE